MREGGRDSLVARLHDSRLRERAKAEMLREDPSWENQYLCCGGADGILIASVVETSLKKYEGKRLGEIARAEGRDPIDVLMDIVAADRANTSNIIFIMDEADVRAALRSSLVAFCTDSPAVAEDGIFSQEKSHPRAWGSAARILGHYVRDEKILTLEQAIYKMTSLPASRLKLEDRGVLAPGMFADLVAFDPEKVRDVSTFDDPLHYSQGIPYVAVNGALVVDGGKITSARPGRVLRGPGWKPAK
jgi:N-acyl-D-aspartate/D-glutamate deacylase